MGPVQGQGGRETEGTAHLPALPPARLRAEDQGPGEGGGNGASLPDPAYHRLGEIVRDRLAVAPAHFALPQQGRDAPHLRYHHRGHRPQGAR